MTLNISVMRRAASRFDLFTKSDLDSEDFAEELNVSTPKLTPRII